MQFNIKEEKLESKFDKQVVKNQNTLRQDSDEGKDYREGRVKLMVGLGHKNDSIDTAGNKATLKNSERKSEASQKVIITTHERSAVKGSPR